MPTDMINPIFQITRIDRLSERLVTERFFYGWTIVLITFSTSMITAGIGGYGLSFFVIPMSEALGVSRTEFSGIIIFRLALLPLMPLMGILVDKKHGPRLMLVFGSIFAGIALMLTSRVDSLWQFYIVFGVIFGLATMTMGGQLVGPAVISKWFIKKRGRAMAIGTMGISAGGVVIAPLAGWLVGEYGWRTAWVVLGLVLILVVAPAAALFMRRSPEDVNLLPDGDAAPTTQSAALQNRPSEVEYSWTLRQALKTQALWIVLAVQVLMLMSLMPVLFHQVAYIQDKGYDLTTAATVATTLAFSAMVSKLFWGYLTERMHVRWVIALCFVPSGLSLFLLVWAQSVQMLFVYAVIHGFAMGGAPTLMNVVWASYFGRQHMGAIRGVVTPVGMFFGSFSPIFAGWLWTPEKSYGVSFIIFALTYVAGGLLIMMVRSPRAPSPASLEKQAAPVL